MADDLRLELGENPADVFVTDVHVDERRALRDVRATASAVFPQRIEHEDVVPFCQVTVDDVGSDEPGPAGNENAQRAVLSTLDRSDPASQAYSNVPPFALILAATAVVLGTLAATPLPLDERALVAAGCVALGAYAYWRRCETRQVRAVILCALAAGAVNAVCHEKGAEAPFELRTARYAGALVSRSAESQFVVALDDGRNVLAEIHGDPPAPGTRVELLGRLASFDDARNPGEPSERAIQRERGIDAQLESAVLLHAYPGSPWDARAWLPRAHEWAYAQLQRRLGEPSASVVAGELWGERAALPPDLRLEFQETGTVHVLVTAGLHLGAVATLALVLFSLGMPPRRLTCALAILAVWIFAIWSGAQLPAIRAATMVSVALAARASGRAALSWNSLAIAAALVALLRPESVATASFVLSFSCVGAIFAIAKPLERRMHALTALPMPVREAIVLSVATQLGTWPLSAAIFLQFAAYSPLANLGVVPCVAATMALGAAQLALAWCAPLAQACANVNSWLLAWMLAVVRTLSSLPGASTPMTPAPAWCIALYDAALLAAPWLWRNGARTAAAAGLLIAAGFVLWPPRGYDGFLRVTVLDVGQADSIVVETPAGHAILVDAGGRLERGQQGEDSTAERIGERIVVPFLLRRGIHQLDAVIISHPHGDHVGGCAPVLRKLRVAELADGGQTYGGHAYQDCLDVARAEGVSIVYPRAGTNGTPATACRCTSSAHRCRSSRIRETTSTRTRWPSSYVIARSACSSPATPAPQPSNVSFRRASTCGARFSK